MNTFYSSHLIMHPILLLKLPSLFVYDTVGPLYRFVINLLSYMYQPGYNKGNPYKMCVAIL